MSLPTTSASSVSVDPVIPPLLSAETPPPASLLTSVSTAAGAQSAAPVPLTVLSSTPSPPAPVLPTEAGSAAANPKLKPFFASRLPVPVRQRSLSTRPNAKARLASFVLTSNDHISAVEAKVAKVTAPKTKGQPKKAKTKRVSQPNRRKTGGKPKPKRGSKRGQGQGEQSSAVDPHLLIFPPNYYCTVCRARYGDPNDAKAGDDWLECCKCQRSFHESCAEANGILDDDDSFTCGSCFDQASLFRICP